MNGFILVFGMALVLAVERRLAADRAAAGRPARSPPRPTSAPAASSSARSRAADGPARERRQSRGRVPVRSRRPRLWSGTRPQPATPPARGRRQSRGRVPGRSPMAKCSRNAFPRRPTVAIYRRHAFPGVRPWQDIAAMHSRAAIRGSFFASCVPEGASDGKNASSRQHIAAVHPKRAGFGKTCAPCIRKAPQTGVRGCTARRSCHEGALFAARVPQIMHGARILPSFGARRVLGLMRERLGAGLRKRTPYCCRRSRVPARHLVAFCGGSLSRSKRLALRHAALAVTIPRCGRPVLQPTSRPLSVGSGFP